MGQLLQFLPSITSAISKGIQGGFTGLNHEVDVWLFLIPATLWLVAQFGMQWGVMLQDLGVWVQATPTQLHQVQTIVRAAPHATLAYSLWTPGAVGSAVPLTMGWSPAWAVLVGMIWTMGVLGGIARIMAGHRGITGATLATPLITGIVLFVTPRLLPWFLTQTWHVLSVRSLVPAIGHLAGLTPTQSAQWLTNPFWLWGALWGLSGSHGLAYVDKMPYLLGTPLTVAVAADLAKTLVSLMSVAGGNLSVPGAVGSWLYAVFHVGVALTVALTVVQTLWTLILLLGALWLGLSPLWIWVIAFDPWTLETTRRMAGLTIRIVLLQVAAWVWTTVIVVFDGGDAHGPLGLSKALTGLTPWVAGIVTAVAVVAAWRWVLVPLKLWVREGEIAVLGAWSQWQQQIGAVSEWVGGGLIRAASGWSGETATTVRTTGEAAHQWGVDRRADATALRQRTMWSPAELAEAQAARWGSSAAPEWNPLPAMGALTSGVADGTGGVWHPGPAEHIWRVTGIGDVAQWRSQLTEQAWRDVLTQEAWQEAEANQVAWADRQEWVTRRTQELLQGAQRNHKPPPQSLVPVVWQQGDQTFVTAARLPDYQTWWDRAAAEIGDVPLQPGESPADHAARRLRMMGDRVQAWVAGDRPWPSDLPRPVAVPPSWKAMTKPAGSGHPQRTRQGMTEEYRQGVWTVRRWWGGDEESAASMGMQSAPSSRPPSSS